jgi:hypothetical protein
VGPPLCGCEQNWSLGWEFVYLKIPTIFSMNPHIRILSETIMNETSRYIVRRNTSRVLD